MKDARQILLWGEDRLDTVIGDITFAHNQDWLTVVEVSGPTGLKNELDRALGNPEKYPLAGIVMDIQLFGVQDVFPFTTKHERRFESNEAGWNLVDDVLRSIGSPFKDVPILIYSVQPLDEEGKRRLESINKRDGTPLTYLEKEFEFDRPAPLFRDWILSLKTRKQGHV